MTFLADPDDDALLAHFTAVKGPIIRVHISDNYRHRAVLFVGKCEHSLCLTLDIEMTDRVREHFAGIIVEARACETI